MLHTNPNKILPRLPTDEEVAFFDRDEDDDDVEGGKIDPRTSVEGCDGFGNGILVLSRVSRGVGEEPPERHFVRLWVYKSSLALSGALMSIVYRVSAFYTAAANSRR
jgi:hypothetical protein